MTPCSAAEGELPNSHPDLMIAPQTGHTRIATELQALKVNTPVQDQATGLAGWF